MSQEWTEVELADGRIRFRQGADRGERIVERWVPWDPRWVSDGSIESWAKVDGYLAGMEAARQNDNDTGGRVSWDTMKLAEVQRELARCREALRIVEWSGAWSEVFEAQVCPNCGFPESAGHLQWCVIGRALGTVEPILSSPDSETES